MIFPNGMSWMFLGQPREAAKRCATEVLAASADVIHESFYEMPIVGFTFEDTLPGVLPSDAGWLVEKYAGAECAAEALVMFLNEIAGDAGLLVMFGEFRIDPDLPDFVLVELQ